MKKGNYNKQRRIYSGPISEIYEATNDKNEVVCLKIVDVDLCLKPHNIEREIAILKNTAHQNVLPYLDSYRISDDAVLVTPLYKYDLDQLLKSHVKKSVKFNLDDPSKNIIVHKNRFPLPQIRRILEGISEALVYLHEEKGVIHRDIKPSNVFFTGEDSAPILADFGISYPTCDPPTDEPPSDKYLDVCTGIYKAPELCFGVTDYSFEVDIWSLGVMLTVLYSSNARSFIQYENNDLALISSVFKNLGTPSLDPSEKLYWPQMCNDDYHFKNFNFIKYPRKSTLALIPRCDDSSVSAIFDSIMVYESSQRATARDVLSLLRHSRLSCEGGDSRIAPNSLLHSKVPHGS